MPSSDAQLTVLATPDLPIADLPEIVAPSSREIQAIIDNAQPALFKQSATGKAAGRLLTTDDLKRAFCDQSVTVSVSKTGAFRYEPQSKTQPRYMPFSAFAEYAENVDTLSTERLYLSQFPIDAAPEVLARDVARPRMPEDTAAVTRNLWFGPAGTISPLHFDRSHNLLHQHYGRKHIVIVDPSHTHLMKAGSKNSASPHVSSIDLVVSGFNVDLARLGAPCMEAVLEPGDILFLPAFWWHNVISLDVSISVNYWWRPPLSACLWPNFLRMVSSRTMYHDPSVIAQWVEIAPHKVDTAFCCFLADEGQTLAGAALAGAIVTAFCGKVLRILAISESADPTPETADQALPDFARAAAIVPALVSQGLINTSQCGLLLKWLELAAETANAPEPCAYSAERSGALRDLIRRLHIELGDCLLT
jgi:lysine-specific demethylase 8